jgi:hypothetical protein
MPTNLFFNNFGHYGQQTLLEDLIIESIKMYGHDVYYIPRTLVKEDNLFGEDVLSKFDDYFQLEIYIKNVEGFEGEGDFLSKFNVEIRDEMTFTLSKRRFTEEVNGSLITQEDGSESTRPLEGDLIYLPFTGGLFEIKFVEDESVFYQMGNLAMYDLKCELFEYSHEELDTGIPAIDNIQTIHSTVMQDFSILDEASNVLVFETGDAMVAEDYRIDSIATTANNEYIQTETTSSGSLGAFLDFSEQNPFSEGSDW